MSWVIVIGAIGELQRVIDADNDTEEGGSPCIKEPNI